MHILGLADSGKIWQWDDIDRDARHIKFLHTDLLENSPTGGHGTVTRVVAGWDRATAYIVGTGIVFWDPNLVVGQHDEAVDGVLIDPITIPATAYRKRRVERQSTLEAGDNVGEVINHIVLEGYIVFITDLNKTFAVKSSFPDDESLELVELTTISDLLGAGPSNIQDIQGSFRNFAIFTTTGEVFTADRQFLDAFWENKSSDQAVEQLPKPARIPALQHTGVISMAFGDYHYHALHSDGQLSSYGTEPQWCGALGLGSRFDGSMLRGFRYQNHWGGDGTVSPHGYSSGHRIWFEPEKKLWLAHMKEATRSPEAVRRVTMAFQSEEVNADMAEWFEQEGRGWDDFEDLNDPNEPVLGAYFVLSVAAAGWHSGALVLVDEKRAAMVRERYLVKPNSVSTAEAVDDRYEQQSMIASLIGWLYRMGRSFLGLDAHIGQHEERWPAFESAEGRPSGDVKYIWHNQPFPRIRLSTGEEMPGDVPLSEWRYGVPDRRIRNTERP